MRLASFNLDRRPTDEPVLVQQAQQGDRQAFGVLIERYWDRLYRWLYHLSRHRHTAEDLAQETFLKAFAKLASFRAGTNFRAWLFRIAYNGLLNHQRVDGRARPLLTDQLSAPQQGPVEQVLSEEALRLLGRALGRLPKEFRAAFLLRVEENLSFRQIAGVLGITEETARWRVFKARKKLMAVLAPQFDLDEP